MIYLIEHSARHGEHPRRPPAFVASYDGLVVDATAEYKWCVGQPVHEMLEYCDEIYAVWTVIGQGTRLTEEERGHAL